jgi:hypothetical protein
MRLPGQAGTAILAGWVSKAREMVSEIQLEFALLWQQASRRHAISLAQGAPISIGPRHDPSRIELGRLRTSRRWKAAATEPLILDPALVGGSCCQRPQW